VQAFTAAAVKGAFGLPIEELFDTFDIIPLASGTIGQVRDAH
jgi:predicted unusual protein kinase regulating ubiquinone biosynthesis (AarF/ABC1/UbiB family)